MFDVVLERKAFKAVPKQAKAHMQHQARAYDSAHPAWRA